MTQESPHDHEPPAMPPPRLARGRRRLAFAVIAIAILVIVAVVYLATVDAVRMDTLSLSARQEVILDGSAGPGGERFQTWGLKNVMPVSITLLGMEPVGTPSDWRVVQMRLGAPLGGAQPFTERTEPFIPQRLAPRETLAVIIVYEPLPCDSPQVADGVLSGPIDFRIRYSILGIHRTATFYQDGARVIPSQAFGCPSL